MTDRYSHMFRFYLPLAATSMLMMASHSIVSSGLARTSNAAQALAAYAVAQSLAVMFESPCYTMQRMGVALFKDRLSYDAVKKVTLGLWGVLTGIMLLIAFTPLSILVFSRAFNVPSELVPEAARVFRVFMVLPAFSAFRSFYQGLIIVSRRTHLLTLNMLARLGVMFGLAALLPRFESLPGGVVGAIILGAGIGTEGLMAYFTGRHVREELPNNAEVGTTPWQALMFFLPLALASFTNTFVRPVVNAALGRTVDPTIALASYQVAWSFSFIFSAVAFNIHQVVLVYVRGAENRLETLRFAVTMGLAGTGLLLTVALTPLGRLILHGLMGVSLTLTEEVISILQLLAFLPLITSVSEYCVGLLILEKRTRIVTLGKVAHVITVLIASVTLTALVPHLGGRLAAACMVCGASGEAALVVYQARKTYVAQQLTAA